MLGTLAIVLLVPWALGLVTAYTMGGFIHILVVAAVILVLVNVVLKPALEPMTQGRMHARTWG
jgi:uncharacterized membrane protein YvlD (DUF360 family)